MKHKTLKIAIASLLAFAAVGCAGEEGETQKPMTPSITLSQSTVTLDVGEYTTLSAVLYKLEGNITWSSANSDVVSIIDGETLYAVGEGETTVTATCGGYSASAQVTVESDVIDPEFTTFLALSTYTERLEVGESKGISAWLEYKNGAGQITDIKLSYLSSNTEVVDVIEGKLTAKKSGNAIVYVATKYQGETYVNSVAVSVTGEDGSYVPEGVFVDVASNVYVKVGQTQAVAVGMKNGITVIPASEYAVSMRVKVGSNVVEIVEDSDGYSIKGLVSGNAIVEVSCTYKGETLTATFQVGVSA